jgi:hypothetical protein
VKFWDASAIVALLVAEETTRRLQALAAKDSASTIGRYDEILVERIGMGLDLDPFAAAGNDREHRRPGRHDPHIVLQLGRILFGSRLFRERPRQHELGL